MSGPRPAPPAPAAGGPLRILMVSEDLPARAVGGLGRHVVTLGNALLAAGHTVTLMGRNQPDIASCADEVGFHGPFIAGFPDPWQAWHEHRLGFYVSAKRPYYARRIAAAIVQQAAGHDVVHYHGHLALVGRYLPPALPFLQTRHDQGSDCITHLRFRQGQPCEERAPSACAGCRHPAPGPLRTWLSTRAVQRYRRETAEAFERHPVVFVSEFLRANYLRTLPQTDMSRSAVVHNFVDEPLLAGLAGPRPAAPGRPFVVHLAGRLEPAKGIAAFITRLMPRMPAHWQVQVHGDGPDRPRLAALGDPRLVLHGHQPLTATLAAAARADLTVVPSVCAESCSTVVLESLRLGTPCHALNRGGTPELARYGPAGHLHLHDDLDALVDGVLHAEASAGAQPAPGQPAGVQARLPELLALYRRVVRTAGPGRDAA